MRITGLKTKYTPLKRSESQTLIAWDYAPVFTNEGKESIFGTWQEMVIDHIADFSEIKKIIISFYNEQTRKDIINGFSWKGNNVWLSEENQINYKAIYDMAEISKESVLPIKVKFGTDDNIIYYEFSTIEEYRDFYFSSVKHIQDTIRNGWVKKDSIDWKLYQ